MPDQDKWWIEILEQASSAWDNISTEELPQVYAFAGEYKQFIERCKTEREVIAFLENPLASAGAVNLGIETLPPAVPGTRFYLSIHHKAIAIGVLGTSPLANGLRIIGVHADSPRLDLKPKPIYEEGGLALAKTHYYGGIKKYQWLGIPLALHGLAVKKDGSQVDIVIGEEEEDPVFTITDLLPHLAKEQINKKMGEAVAGEELNVLIGSKPHPDREAPARVKLAVLQWLKDKYSLEERDLISAEVEVVPAGRARDIGFDRGMVGAYGQDDRICVYAAWKALEAIKSPVNTALYLVFDKEEIGSTGNTAAQGRLLEYVIELIQEWTKNTPMSLNKILYASQALSADVNAADDPLYPKVMDKYNSAKAGWGVVLTKYTGTGGKYGTNDCHAEFLAIVRQRLEAEGVAWQIGELGKVDQGGGGTIAQYLANQGMQVLDCGPALLSMHSPFEVSSKVDLWMTWKAYHAFWNS